MSKAQASELEHLRECKTLLCKAQTLAHMGSWTLAPDGKAMIWSDEACRIFGLPIGEPVTLEALATCIHPEDRTQVLADFRAALQGEPLDIGHRIIVDDEIYWIKQKAELEFDADGTVVGGVGVVQDVTTQRLAATQLADLVEFTGRIIAESPVGIAVFHTNGQCLLANEYIAKIFNVELDVLRYANFRELDVWDQFDLREASEAALRSGKTQRKLTTNTRNDGAELSIDCEFTTVMQQNEVNLLVLIRDVSEFHAAERALKEAMTMAEEANRTKSEFLANMSHEIRTPMNAVIGLAQLALDQNSDPDLTDYLRQMYGSATSLLRIINDILDYSKIEAGRLAIEHKLFNTGDLTRNVIGMFSTQANAKGLKLEARIAPDVPETLVGDSLRLDQVLINLVGNAVKFTEHGGISIQIDRIDDAAIPEAKFSPDKVVLRFSVSDTGLGMNEETQGRLFQPFSQADGSITRRFGGTGLGLTISRRLILLMGGDIRVASTPGVGSCFSFTIALDKPIVPHQPSAPAANASLSVAKKLDLASAGRPIAGARILLVEDDRVNQRVVCEVLKRAGLDAVIASEGSEALELLNGQVFDAVLMDIEMPEMDGFEATRQIRADTRWIKLPIIAFTAAVLQHDRDKCLAAGMTDFVTKPTQPRALLDTLLRHVPPRNTIIVEPTAQLPDSPIARLDKKLALATLASLETRLEQSAFVGALELREMRNNLAGLDNPALEHLFDAISRYDYASAKRLLSGLLTEVDDLRERNS